MNQNRRLDVEAGFPDYEYVVSFVTRIEQEKITEENVIQVYLDGELIQTLDARVAG